MGRISKRTVDEMVVPVSAKTRSYLWDDRLPGFGVMATASGAKSYIVQYRLSGAASPTRRVTIGRHGAPWTPDRARERAADVLEQVRKKIDPFEADRIRIAATVAAKRQAEEARHIRDRLGFSTYADQFIARYARRRQKARTAQETEQIVKRDLKPHFGDRAIVSITPSDILQVIDKIHERSPSASLKAYRTLSTIFRWAGSRHDIADDPMRNLKPPHVQPSRDRVLSDLELVAVWQAAAATPYPYGLIVHMLILTGQRREEVAGMEWDEIDLEQSQWTVPGARTKNGRPSIVPLTAAATALIERIPRLGQHLFTTNGKSPFSGFSKAKKRLDRALQKQILNMRGLAATQQDSCMMPWRLHDLRRTLATGLQRQGVRLEVTEAVLNHVSGSRAGIVGIYQRYDYAVEKRAALEAWDARITDLLMSYTATSANVSPGVTSSHVAPSSGVL